jgi:type VI secretion system protein ImpB
MSDLSGTSKEPLPKIKDRKFVEIDRDSFNEVLNATRPEVTAVVDNKLTGSGQIAVTLKIRHMDDFRPERIVEQVEPLNKLLRARERLNDLLAKLEGNDELAAALQRASASEEHLKQIKEESEKLAKPAEG